MYPEQRIPTSSFNEISHKEDVFTSLSAHIRVDGDMIPEVGCQ